MITISVNKAKVSLSIDRVNGVDMLTELTMGVVKAVEHVAKITNADPFYILKGIQRALIWRYENMEDDKDESVSN